MFYPLAIYIPSSTKYTCLSNVAAILLSPYLLTAEVSSSQEGLILNVIDCSKPSSKAK